MKDNVHIAGIGCAEAVTMDRAVTVHDAMRLNWQELAERRLDKLTEAEYELTATRDRLERLQSDYGALVRQGAEQCRRIAALTRDDDEQRDRIAALTREGDEQQHRIAALIRESDERRFRIAGLERELAQMLASRSWRWTLPIRWFTTCLRRVKAKLLPAIASS